MNGVPISPVKFSMRYLDRTTSVPSAYILCLLDVYILFVRRAAPLIALAASLAGNEENEVYILKSFGAVVPKY